MMTKLTFKSLATAIIILVTLTTTMCAQARRPPGQESNDTETSGQTTGPEDGKLEYPRMRIEADFNGWETSFERMKITHMALAADKDLDYLVKVTVTVNDELAGFLYADGWEGVSREELRIGPGDISQWVPVRGVWNPWPGGNVLKLVFHRETITDMPTDFRGYLHLKYDPAALEAEAEAKAEEEDSTDKQASE